MLIRGNAMRIVATFAACASFALADDAPKAPEPSPVVIEVVGDEAGGGAGQVSSGVYHVDFFPQDAKPDQKDAAGTADKLKKLGDAQAQAASGYQQAVQEYFRVFPHQNPLGDAPAFAADWLIDGDSFDETTGALIVSADGAIKNQLGLSDDMGLVVVRVHPNGPAAKVGLVANDILLQLDGAPLSKPEDLKKKLEASGEKKKVALRVLRAGKPLVLQVQPVRRIVLGAVQDAEASAPTYVIGVSATPIENTLRVHLDLPKGAGLIVTEDPVKDTPAAAAGIAKNDILLKLNGQLIASTEALAGTIQSIGPKEAKLELLRGGKPTVVKVTPTERKEAVAVTGMQWSSHPHYYDLLRLTGQLQSVTTPNPVAWGTQASDDPTKKELAGLKAELKELQKAIAELKKAIDQK
jgi:membrane-associated protease RseP (regulator of RpoE activity)